jgi:hypothetical protein
MSSLILADAMMGVAGRGMASGGGGITISGGRSMAISSEGSNETSSAVISGHKTKMPKCRTVAMIMDPQNQAPKDLLNRSLAEMRGCSAQASTGKAYPFMAPPPTVKENLKPLQLEAPKIYYNYNSSLAGGMFRP